MPCNVIIFHCHLILCQRSCLIRTDDRYTSQTFYSLELTDDRMLLAIFCVPKDSTIVTIELNASGIAATARATAKQKGVSRLISSEDTDTEQDCTENDDQNRKLLSKVVQIDLKRSSLFRGTFNRLAIFPTSVPIPIAVTSYAARPYVTKLPENTRLV